MVGKTTKECGCYIKKKKKKKKKKEKATPNKHKTHSDKQSNTNLERICKLVESAWANIGFFLYQLDPEVRRLECLHHHLKILKKKQSAVFI